MRIKEIQIEGLFDMFDHTISLKTEERLSIIYGINGIGKTMLFKILDNLFNINLIKVLALLKSPFNVLRIIYDDGKILEVINDKTTLTILLGKEGNLQEIFKEFQSEIYDAISNPRSTARIANLIRRDFRFLHRDNVFISEVTGERLYIEQLIEKYFDYFPSDTIELEIPTELKERLEKPPIHFIQTQRLILFQPIKSMLVETYGYQKEDSVSKYSSDIANKIQLARERRDRLSNELQQSLHKRILTNGVKINYTLEELNNLSSKIEKRAEELKEIGLLEHLQIGNLKIPNNVDEIQRAILSVNIQDINETLNTFNDLYPRLEKFREILNNRRLSFKEITITEKGVVFTNAKGKTLNATDLSSGEQHELVLLYLLLFEIPENALILIDEPEISLHITWQKAFLEDMKEIIKLRNFDILVATHSPSIINGNWDLTIQLKGNGESE